MKSALRAYLPHYCIIIAATLVVYVQTLGFGILAWDDMLFISPGKPGGECVSLDGIKAAFLEHGKGIYGYRPLHIISYMIDTTIWGRAAWGFHLTNLLLHCLNALLVFHLARKLFASCTCASANAELRKEQPSLDANRGALLAALFFTIFPYHLEAVAWIAERKGLLAFTFIMLATLADLAYRESGRVRFLLLAFLACGASLLSKSAWACWPAIACLLALLDSQKENQAVRLSSWLKKALPLYCLPAIAGAVIQLKIGNAPTVVPLGDNLLERGIFGILTYGYYLLCFLRPGNTMPINDWAYWGLPAWPMMIAAMLTMAAAIIGCALAWRRGLRWPLVAAGVFFFSLLPVSNLVPMCLPHGDRFLYGPSLAVLLPLGLMSGWLVRQKNLLLKILPPLLLIIYGFYTWQSVKPWQNVLALWQRQLDLAPENRVGNCMAGAAFYDHKMYEKAAECLLRAAEPAPCKYYVKSAHGPAAGRLAMALEMQGKNAEAEQVRLRYIAAAHVDKSSQDELRFEQIKLYTLDDRWKDAKKLWKLAPEEEKKGNRGWLINAAFLLHKGNYIEVRQGLALMTVSDQEIDNWRVYLLAQALDLACEWDKAAQVLARFDNAPSEDKVAQAGRALKEKMLAKGPGVMGMPKR